MIAIKVRRGIVYVTTAIFFFVAATAQLQGNTPLDAFWKAGVAAAVMTCGGLVLAHIVDDAAKKPATKKTAATTAKSQQELPAATTTALAEGNS